MYIPSRVWATDLWSTRRYDDDGSGEIDAMELAQLMESLGHEITEKEADKMVKEIDQDNSGKNRSPLHSIVAAS